MSAPAEKTEDGKILLPGMAVVSLYLLLLAGVNIMAVVMGQVRPAYLIFSACFIAAALGFLQRLRWAWALIVGAMVLLAGLFFWRFATEHAYPFAVQGLFNVVVFLYLVRTEVRDNLR